MDEKIKHRGGARPGAGRKANPDKKIFKAVFITEEAYNLLNGIKNKSSFVSSLIINALKKP